jgi:hypothetical protein
MALNWIDVTAVGEVVIEKDRTVLKVAGSDQTFVLREDPGAKKDGKTAFARLREAVKGGQNRVSVTGRLEGWRGHFPPFLKELPPRPRTILVKDFHPTGPDAPARERSRTR